MCDFPSEIVGLPRVRRKKSDQMGCSGDIPWEYTDGNSMEPWVAWGSEIMLINRD